MLLWMDGPDHYGTNIGLLLNGAYADIGNCQIAANSGPGGVGHAMSVGNNVGGVGGYALRWVLPGNRKLIGMGMRMFVGSLPTGESSSPYLFHWRDPSNNELAYLQLTSTGALRLVVAGATVYTSPPLIVAQSWQHIECRLGLGASAAYAINVDGLPVVNVDAAGFADANIAQVAWGGNSFGGGFFFSARDFYVYDDQGDFNTGMQGDRQVLTSFPNDDGPEQDWAYSAGGSGWPLISNNPPDDSQYIYADAAGDLSDFPIDPIDVTITSISAVRIAARAWKSDAGIGTVSLGMVSSGTKSAVIEKALSTEKVYYSQIVENDPHAAARWTPVTLNAALVELNRVQ